MVAATLRAQRKDAAARCGAPGPGPKTARVPSDPDAEPAHDLGFELEQVHAQRLRTLLDIYSERQRAAGKEIKRLSGMKFWIEGYVSERAVVTDEGSKLLVTDATGECFIIMYWMRADEDDPEQLKARTCLFAVLMRAGPAANASRARHRR